MRYSLAIVFLLSILTFSCNNDDDNSNPEPEPTANLTLNFNFKVDEEALELGTGEYVFADEDTVSIDQFKFILSNLTLKKSDNTEWKDEDGYYLVKASNGVNNYELTIEDVPIGSYSSIEFYIGMDSSMNFKPENFPILFQQEGMYWDWDSGYKFLVLEGRYFSSVLTTPNNTAGFIIHIGEIMNLEIPEFEFSNDLSLSAGNQSKINFDVDIEKIFTSPNRISLTEINNRNIMGGPNAGLVSANYSEQMIIFKSIE